MTAMTPAQKRARTLADRRAYNARIVRRLDWAWPALRIARAEADATDGKDHTGEDQDHLLNGFCYAWERGLLTNREVIRGMRAAGLRDSIRLVFGAAI